MSDPDGCLGIVWNPAAFYFPADFLGVFHILFARPVNQTDSAFFFRVCPIAHMYLVELLGQAVPHYVALQGFIVGVTAVWDFAV